MGTVSIVRRLPIALVSALVLTLVGCAGPKSTLPTPPPAPATSPTSSPQPTFATIPVVVAVTDIARGTKITGDMVTIAPYPLEKSPPHAFGGVEVLGTFAAVPIFRGQPIYEQMVVGAPSQVCKAT